MLRKHKLHVGFT